MKLYNINNESEDIFEHYHKLKMKMLKDIHKQLRKID